MVSVDNDNEIPQPETVPEHFGRALGEAREAKSLGLPEMASRLCQTATRLRLIESGQWDQLGPAVYARGYVTAYARELGLDVTATAAYFEDLERQRLAREKEVASRRPRKSKLRNYHMLFAYVAATALVAVPVASWLIHAFQGGAARQIVRQEPANSGAEAKLELSPVSSNQPLLASMTTLPDMEPQPAPRAPVLLLRFNEEVWVEARDQQGARLAYGLMAAGSEQRLPTDAGLSVRLGNPGGVSAELDGEAFDLNPHTRDDLTEFVIPAPRQQ